MIERIFHTVGQGAFYSEKHENFNIVYDCGTEWKNRTNKTIDKTIKQSFSKDDEIDILFISHFDYDHEKKVPDTILTPFCVKIDKYNKSVYNSNIQGK